MKRKTIKRLMSTKKIVYVKLSTERVAEAFFALAKLEGFTLDKDLNQKGISQNCFVKLNENMTISYPSYHTWAGAMKFHHTKIENGKKVVKIDFEAML